MYLNFVGAPLFDIAEANQKLLRLERLSRLQVQNASTSARMVNMEALDRDGLVTKDLRTLPFALPIRSKVDAYKAHLIMADDRRQMERVVEFLVKLCKAEYQFDNEVNCNALVANALIGRYDAAYFFVCHFTRNSLTITSTNELVLNKTHKLPLESVWTIREVHQRVLRTCVRNGWFPAQTQATTQATTANDANGKRYCII